MISSTVLKCFVFLLFVLAQVSQVSLLVSAGQAKVDVFSKLSQW